MQSPKLPSPLHRRILRSLVMAVAMYCGSSVFADTVAYWNFNALSIAMAGSPGSGGVPTSLPANQGSGTLSLSGYGGTVDDFAGSDVNAIAPDVSGASLSLIAGGSSAPFPGNGTYLEIQLNLADFSDPVVTFATRGTSSGFNTGTWSYSVNGGAFTTISSVNTATTMATFALSPAVDLTAINAVDGQANVILRYTVSGATSGTGNNRIDNLRVNATRSNDTVAPELMTLAPLDGATNVPVTSTPTLLFNEPVRKGTGNLVIRHGSNLSMVETFAVSSPQVTVSGSNVTITPSSNFDFSTGYFIELATGAIEDLAGNDFPGISGATAWNFTTATVGVQPSATKTFSTGEGVRLTGSASSSDYYGQGNGQGSFAVYGFGTFNFSNLDFGLSVNSIITGVTKAEFTLTHNDRTFTQGTELELFLTTDSSVGKSFDAAHVNGIDSAQYSFSPTSLGKFAYTPEPGGSTDTFTLNLGAAAAVLVSRLNTGENFSILLAATTSSAAITYSGRGNAFDPGDPSLKFTVSETTGTDTSPPTIAFFTPADGAGSLPIASNLTASFSERIRKGASGTITIFRENGAVFETLDVNSSHVTVNLGTVTIDPTNPFEPSGAYYVQIAGGAIEDFAGNAFAGITDTATWNFSAAQPPIPPTTDLEGYYAPARGLAGSALQNALHGIIGDHVVIDYGTIDEVMSVIDESPTDNSLMRLIYSNATLPKTSANIAGGWNREHVWPRSDGVGDDGPDYSDLHHLFPCRDTVNSLRSNLPFDEGANLESDPFAPESFKDDDSWEPLDRDKGIVARALLYMMVRYDGAEALTSDLVLADNPASVGTMGMLSTLLAWHRAFPPTDYERARNHAIQTGATIGNITYAQGNRNPFIDFPQFADAIFLGAGTNTFSKWQLERFTIAQLEDPAVSGADADADGDGLTTYQEYLQNGNPLSGGDAPLTFSLAGNQLTLVFHRPKGAAEVTKLKTSTMPEGGHWSEVPNWEASTAVVDLGNYQRLTYSGTINPITDLRRFWRVTYE